MQNDNAEMNICSSSLPACCATVLFVSQGGLLLTYDWPAKTAILCSGVNCITLMAENQEARLTFNTVSKKLGPILVIFQLTHLNHFKMTLIHFKIQ